MTRLRTNVLAGAALLVAGGGVSPAADGRDAERVAGGELADERPSSPAQDPPPAPPQDPDPPAPAGPAPETPAPAQPDPPPAPAETPPVAKPAAPPAADPAAPASADAAPTDEEHAAARKVVEAAADRQGGKSLAPPDGALASFSVTFAKVTVHRDVVRDDGSTTRQRIDSEDDGLQVFGLGRQLRTVWRLSGERPVSRGVKLKAKTDGTFAELAWVHDGAALQALGTGARFEKDREQLDRDRAVVTALLDVAVLRRMLSDGSRWKIVDDATNAGTAVRRTPPVSATATAGTAPLTLVLWIDDTTRDVTAAMIPATAAGGATTHLEFRYHATFPKVTGSDLRFPFEVHVSETNDAAAERLPVMDAFARQVTFNDLAQADVDPPK